MNASLRHVLFVVALLSGLPAPAAAVPAKPAVNAREAGMDARFRAIYRREWAWRQQQDGSAGDEDSPRTRIRLPDVSPAAQAARLKVWESVLRELDAIDPARLSRAERVNYRIYRPQVEARAASVRFRDYEMPFNADSSFWSGLGFMGQRTLRSATDYRDYLAMLEDVPRYFDAQIANMRAGLARGFSVPRATLDGRDASIAQVAALQDVEQAAIEDVRGDPAELVAGFGDPRPLEALPAAGQPFLPAAGGGGHRLAVPICSAKRSSTSFACKAPMTSSSLPSMMLSRQ